MKYHALATLTVRVLGLLLIAWSLLAFPSAILTLGNFLWDLFAGPGGAVGRWYNYNGIDSLWHLAITGIGLYMLLNGRWIISRLTRGLAGTCPYCGYSLKGLAADRCPECGSRIERDPPRA